jgi:hypothetical protein
VGLKDKQHSSGRKGKYFPASTKAEKHKDQVFWREVVVVKGCAWHVNK